MKILPSRFKLLYIYMFCECNHAGIWDVELDVAALRLELDFDEKEVLAQFGDSLRKIKDGKWYLTDFVEFQYGTLNPENRAHKSVIEILKKYKIKPLRSPLQGCKDKDKDKDMDKDKVLDKDKVKEYQARIGKLYNRRESTRWSAKEIEALKKIEEIEEEDFILLEKYYTTDIPNEKDYRRRDLQTLLNNWTGELDRARKWKPGGKEYDAYIPATDNPENDWDAVVKKQESKNVQGK